MTSLLQDMVERVAGTETSARAIESMTRRIEADRASLRAELQQQIYARYALPRLNEIQIDASAIGRL